MGQDARGGRPNTDSDNCSRKRMSVAAWITLKEAPVDVLSEA